MKLENIIQQFLVENEEGLRQLITYFLNQVMEYEAKEQAGADYYERTKGRKAHRNGTRERGLKTRLGKLILNKPQLREVPFVTKVFDRFSRTEKALKCAIVESYIQGVSTRNVKEVLSRFGTEEVSATTVSNLAKELDEAVNEFLNREIKEEISYLFVDASYFKVREGVRYISKALYVVAGVRKDGYRELLGATVADAENELFWEDYFEELKTRGLKGVELIISDGHKGIISAAEKVFSGSSWQMCHVHFIRDVMKKVPNKQWKEISERLKEHLTSVEQLQIFIEELEQEGFEKATQTCERFMFDLFNYKDYPRNHWRRIRTTNMMERLNKELKR